MKHIVVIQSGWMFIGDFSKGDSMFTILNASCIRKWGTTKGVGQLALQGPTKETILEPTGTVNGPLDSLLFVIQTESSLWQ